LTHKRLLLQSETFGFEPCTAHHRVIMETFSGFSLRRFWDGILIAAPILGVALIVIIFVFPLPLTREGDPTALNYFLFILLTGFFISILFFIVRTLAAPFSKSIRQNIRANPRREALWVIATIIVIFSFAVSGKANPNSRSLRTANTRIEMSQLYTAVQAYKTEYGALPRNPGNQVLIKTLTGSNPRKIEFISLKHWELNSRYEMVDAWGTPFRFIFTTSGDIRVQSPGADGIWGTPDDLNSD
jgi:hypothetical protein